MPGLIVNGLEKSANAYDRLVQILSRKSANHLPLLAC
jgi:hypothetical protein